MTSRDSTFVVDTHALVWFLAEDIRISTTARDLLTRAQTGEYRVIVPVIVLAETLTIIEKNRSPLTMSQVMDELRGNPNFAIRYLDDEVFQAMIVAGPGFELHDRSIAATAGIYGCRVITRDQQLQSMISTVW